MFCQADFWAYQRTTLKPCCAPAVGRHCQVLGGKNQSGTPRAPGLAEKYILGAVVIAHGHSHRSEFIRVLTSIWTVTVFSFSSHREVKRLHHFLHREATFSHIVKTKDFIISKNVSSHFPNCEATRPQIAKSQQPKLRSRFTSKNPKLRVRKIPNCEFAKSQIANSQNPKLRSRFTSQLREPTSVSNGEVPEIAK